MEHINNFEVFEVACNYYSKKIYEFKEILERKIALLNNISWIFNKGTTKVCKADETGRKKRCKVGIKYGSKTSITIEDVHIVWEEFKNFFEKTSISTIEYNDMNKEIGRYEFIAKNFIGDEIKCIIYLENEWNIPQINLSVFVNERYKNE